MPKTFLGDCIGNPFKSSEELINIVESGIEIEKDEFMEAVELTKPIRFLIKEYPQDYTYFRTPDKRLYWFRWSAVEFFYQ